jgi:hypothetical protein
MPARFSHFFALCLKKWRKWRALPAENLANKAGIPIFEIGKCRGLGVSHSSGFACHSERELGDRAFGTYFEQLLLKVFPEAVWKQDRKVPNAAGLRKRSGLTS